MNIGDFINEIHKLATKTWPMNVKISCLLHMIIQKSVQLNCVLNFLVFRIQTSFISEQNWRESPSARCGLHQSPLRTRTNTGGEHIPWMAIDNYPGEVVDLSRVADAVLGPLILLTFQAPTQFSERWPASTFENLLVNTEATFRNV